MSVIASMVAVLKAEVGPFQKGMKSAQATLTRVSTSMRNVGLAATAMGGAITAAVGVAATKFSTFGDEVAKMAKRTGLTTEAVSALRFAADQSATSIEAIEKSIRRLSVNIFNGSKAFERYGISIASIRNADPEKQFQAVADAIARIEDPTKKLAAAQELLGRSGAELLPLFEQGGQGLRDYADQAQRLGLIMSADAAASAEILNDKIGQLKLQFQALWVNVGQQLAPALIDLITKVQEFIPPLIEWIGNNDTLIISVAALGAGLVTLGTTLLVVSASIKGFVAAIGLLRVALTFLAAHPLVAIVVGLTALSTWFLTCTESGKSFAAWITDGLGPAIEKAAGWIEGLQNKVEDFANSILGQEVVPVEVGPGTNPFDVNRNEPPQRPPAQQPQADKPIMDLGKIITDFAQGARGKLFAKNIADQLNQAFNKNLIEKQQVDAFELQRKIAAMQPPAPINTVSGIEQHNEPPPVRRDSGVIGGLDAASSEAAFLMAGQLQKQDEAAKQRKEQLKIQRQSNGYLRKIAERNIEYATVLAQVNNS